MEKSDKQKATVPQPRESCGVVMPISAIDSCDEGHWLEVKGILFESIRNANLEPDLVSNADDVGVIQARIVKNLYENPIVVVDVSARNANVMFELGLRLAFDKPTVIVIDDKTPFSFDTAPIEHLRYPRDLRHGKIQKFMTDLSAKLIAVQKNAQDPNYSTFLKHFGSFTAAKLEKKELAPNDFVTFVTNKLEDIQSNLAHIRRNSQPLDRNLDSIPLRIKNMSNELILLSHRLVSLDSDTTSDREFIDQEKRVIQQRIFDLRQRLRQLQES